jgi:hypothetical protein
MWGKSMPILPPINLGKVNIAPNKNGKVGIMAIPPGND